jgi:hypothetical protein
MRLKIGVDIKSCRELGFKVSEVSMFQSMSHEMRSFRSTLKL